jgi:type III secretion system FlhB-like substrate exporter
VAVHPPRQPQHHPVADQARSLFVERAVRILPGLAKTIGEALALLAAQPGSAPQMQEMGDAWLSYQKNHETWIRGTAGAWSRSSSLSAAAVEPSFGGLDKLELLGNEAIEHRIIASRLALRLLDIASWELNDLRLRIQSLEAAPELNRQDIFRPEVLAQRLVEQWMQSGLSVFTWLKVQDLVQKSLAGQMLEIYHATNEFLIHQGVMAEIDLRPLVRRTPSATSSPVPVGATPAPGSLPEKSAAGAGGGSGAAGGNAGGPGGAVVAQPAGVVKVADLQGHEGGAVPGGVAAASKPASHGQEDVTQAGNFGGGHALQDEARLQTGTTPLARVRMRAQGVLGRLRQMLSKQVAGFDEMRTSQAASPLVQAITRLQRPEEGSTQSDWLAEVPDQGATQVHVDQAAGALRQRTSELKQAASTSAEKATIEVVALMFQSILAEDRIPAAIRVWFARLQMPVLRVAISEPEFFGSLQHPARRLIDRMGSCVLGFDAVVAGSALELEIKRVVQVIEQYPETGRRVFELIYDEFDRFLSKFLSERGSAARVVSVAQQIEQKETMAIQYTIELRRMLNDLPVREEIREFLFKVWAEVLALAAMKNGPQDAQTLQFKQAASDLVWAASAKPNRGDRTRVIAELPKQLQLLRQGMSLLGLGAPEQDAQIKIISDILADAFMSKTDAIPMAQVQAMANRLANLEDYLSDEDVGDLSLDTESLVTMIGLDAAHTEVIANGGSEPTEIMRGWARELQLGSWFSLDHNGTLSQVQFVWCSERKQLHLFAAADGRNFLIQMRRLAAYLQAGLMVPTEEEALTVRATREALAKLDANPERLLG